MSIFGGRTARRNAHTELRLAAAAQPR